MRQSGALLPLGIGTILHGCIGFFIALASIRGIEGMTHGGSYCNSWIEYPEKEGKGPAYWLCVDFKAKFDVLLWAFLVSVLIVG